MRASHGLAALLVAGLVTACSESTPPIAPSPTERADTANTVWGVVSERTPDGVQPISDAIVELFLGDSRDPLKGTLSGANGGYVMNLPSPGGSGATGPDGQPFEVRVRKNGYRTASQSFRSAYGVWDYGEVEVRVELVRD